MAISGFCTPLDGKCPDPKDDKLIYIMIIVLFGGVTFLNFQIIAGLVFSMAKSSIERRFKSIVKPAWIGFSVFALFGVWATVKAAIVISMVSHNTECCKADLHGDNRSWVAANVFFILSWGIEYLFALSVIKSRNFILQIFMAILFIGVHIGALVALGIIWNQVAFWFFFGASVFEVGAIFVALWCAKNTKKSKWIKIEAEDTGASIVEALEDQGVRARVLNALGFSIQTDDKKPPVIITIPTSGGSGSSPTSSKGDTTYFA